MKYISRDLSKIILRMFQFSIIVPGTPGVPPAEPWSRSVSGFETLEHIDAIRWVHTTCNRTKKLQFPEKQGSSEYC